MRGLLIIFLIVVLFTVGVVHNPYINKNQAILIAGSEPTFYDANTSDNIPNIRNKRNINYEGDTETVQDFIKHLNASNASPADEKLLAKTHILNEYKRTINRRKRYSYVKNGKVYYTNNDRMASCGGWTYYRPCVPCEKRCRNRQRNQQSNQQSHPQSNQQSNRGPVVQPIPAVNAYTHKSDPYSERITERITAKPIYIGPAKDWLGPKTGCNCNPKGSHLLTCDIKTGQCRCKPHYIGPKCDNCEIGYWDSPEGCKKCHCDIDGSHSKNCDQNGRCNCKSGVAGERCDTCLPGHYGYSKHGCKECEVCNKKGHICDPDTGRCVCPPFSHGESCHLCTTNTWGHEPNKGCKLCNCSPSGSTKMQCDLSTGTCICLQGFTGLNCEQCEHGYFGYPKCRRCSCDLAGTDKIQGKCDQNGICQCNSDGTCPCKSNVAGRRCNECRDGTFGLHIENPDGCTQCYCFGRSTKCTEAGLTWGKIRAPNRTLSIDFIDNDKKQHHGITSNDIIDINNFEELVGTPANISKVHDHFEIPLYWKLPETFNGDRVLSYGGYLRFKTYTLSTNKPENDLFRHYPLVRLEGNGVKLIYKNLIQPLHNHYEIRFHESLWKWVQNDKTASRSLLMIALQNLTGIYIKTTDYSNFEVASLFDVSIDTAIEVSGNPPPLAMGVEKCDCPYEYDANSCQNPSIGFYRSKNNIPTIISTILIDVENVIGQSKRCQCNDRSVKCDIETGYCLDCIDNTAGISCERCAEGYYGDPMHANGKCQACPCPSEQFNFAKSCSKNHRSNTFTCVCKQGYFGELCDKCSPGYFGQPDVPGGSCEACNCNEHGSLSSECDQKTGSCKCKIGLTGPKCSQCEQSRHILENKKCIACDTCIQWLLNDVDDMSKYLKQNTTHLITGLLQPPWKGLNDIEAFYNNVSENYELYLDIRENITTLIDENELDAYETQVDNIERNFNDQQTKLDNLEISSNEIAIAATNIHHALRQTKGKLNSVYESLDKFIDSHISTKEALEKGKQLLKDIENDAELVNSLKWPNEVTKCKEISEMVDELLLKQKMDPKDIRKHLDTLSVKVTDLHNILNGIKKENEITSKLNDDNEDMYKHVAMQLEKIRLTNANITNELKEIEEKNIETNKYLDEIKIIYEELLNNLELDELKDQFKSYIDKFKNFDIDDLYKKIKDHSDILENNATRNTELFNLNEKELRTVEASKRYKDIIETLKDANRTANEAIGELLNIIGSEISPVDDDSLYTNSSLNQAGSDRLQERINVVKNKITEKKQELNALYSTIDNFKRDNWKNGITNNKHADTIDQMVPDYNSKTQALKKIEDIIKKAVQHSDKMREIYKKAQDINISMQYDLVKKHKKYLNLTSYDNIQKLKEKVKVTTELLQRNFINNKTNIDVIKDWNKDYTSFQNHTVLLQDKMKNLRASIKKAQEMAANIQVSLTGDNCARFYRIRKLEPTLLTNITITFSSNGKAATLFYIRNNEAEAQFMSLEITSKQVKFVWNLDVKNDDIVMPNNLPRDVDATINIQRINEKIILTVNNEKKEAYMKKENLLFRVSPKSLFVVGKALNGSSGIPGCIKDINFNGQQIGLWEFEKQEGICTGCNRNNTGLPDGIKYRFNGDGYVDDMLNLDPTQINIKFHMRTFDENSLIFVAPHGLGAYMAISLHNGHLRYELYYNNDKANNKQHIKHIMLETKEKYNDGKEVIIDCSKSYEDKLDSSQFRVNSSLHFGNLNETRKEVDKKYILQIKKSHLYFGGLPPDFNSSLMQVIKNLHTKEPFNGLLYGISTDDRSFTIQSKKSFGIEYQTEDEISYRNVLFDTSSYVKLKINTLATNNKINFVIRTTIPDAFILSIAESDGTPFPFFLQDGRIILKSINCSSNKAYNDDAYHLIFFDSFNNTLSIDGTADVKKCKTKLEAWNNAASNTFWIGGMENESNNFRGIIKDIILNNELITINSTSYISSEGAKIGRMNSPKEKDVDDTSDNNTFNDNMENVTMKDMQHSDGCEPVNYVLEPNAAKFGDAPNSYVKHNFKEVVWKKDFTIEFEFRTFYKNGLLLLAYGPKNHYNLLQVHDGRVELKISNTKRSKILKTHLKIDDGNWHRILIQNSITIKNKRKLLLIVDTERTKAMKIPQNKVGRSFFIGDVPKNETVIQMHLNPFRGCIRNLKLNNLTQGLVNGKNTYHHQIGQCFPNIEMGSYFRGDSYAIYDHNFKVHNYLELNFEFRTGEQNGVLLSVSNPTSSPAFSIELQNGAVVMSVDMGNGITTNVSNSLSKGDPAICNNSWHHVVAVLSTLELTVNVDGVSQSWVLSDVGSLDEMDAPLFVGGLSDQAPVGTLKTRDNFKGCIRNLKIGEDIKDWTDMTLYNVALNSCPVIL